MSRIFVKRVLRLARHRIIAQKGPEIQQHLLKYGGYAEKALDSMGRYCYDAFQNHVGRPVERTAESIMLSSDETYIRCQPVRIIRPISIIITITINITTTPPLEH